MMPKFFDAHTHLNMIGVDPAISLGASWQEVGKQALEAEIGFVNVGADVKSSHLALEQVKELGENTYATVGIHPTEGGGEGGGETSRGDFASIRELAKDEKVVAIGECGLEYRFQNVKSKNQNDNLELKIKEKQKELFIKHLELALKIEKPLMIHCRPAFAHSFGEAEDAYEDLYEILKSYSAKASQDRQKRSFCLHFFTGDWSTAQKFLELGGYLSFPGVITFSSVCDETIKNAPLDRIMAETDAPFATPEPVRAKAGFAYVRNEPAFVSYVAERIAELRPEPREEVLTALVENAKRFYNLL